MLARNINVHVFFSQPTETLLNYDIYTMFIEMKYHHYSKEIWPDYDIYTIFREWNLIINIVKIMQWYMDSQAPWIMW